MLDYNFTQFICLSIYLSIYLPMCLFMSLFICLYICLAIYLFFALMLHINCNSKKKVLLSWLHLDFSPSPTDLPKFCLSLCQGILKKRIDNVFSITYFIFNLIIHKVIICHNTQKDLYSNIWGKLLKTVMFIILLLIKRYLHSLLISS